MHSLLSARHSGTLRDQRGISLIEVLIAAVVLVIVMFWLTTYYVEGRKHLDYEEHRRKATALAQARLDQARTWSYDALLAGANSQASDTTMTVDGRDYTIKLMVSPGPNPHSSTVKAVVEWEATLSYDSRNPFVRTDTTTTIIGRSL
jgi:Tfp pilus assembly protein PilV